MEIYNLPWKDLNPNFDNPSVQKHIILGQIIGAQMHKEIALPKANFVSDFTNQASIGKEVPKRISSVFIGDSAVWGVSLGSGMEMIKGVKC